MAHVLQRHLGVILFVALVHMVVFSSHPINAATVDSLAEARCGDSVRFPGGDEIVVVCGKCDAGEVYLVSEAQRDRPNGGICVPTSLWDFFGGGLPPSIPEPEPPETGGEQRPTREQCAQDLSNCQNRASDLQSMCKASQAAFAFLTAFNGHSCFGDEREIVADLITADFGFLDQIRYCTVDDLKPEATGWDSLQCQARFQPKVVEQCLTGVKASTTTSALSLSLQFTVGGFNVGGGISQTISAMTPPGVGYDKLCAELATKAGLACLQANLACDEAATGAAPISRSIEIEEIRAAVDKDRLGLEAGSVLELNSDAVAPVAGGFYRLAQGPSEPPALYRRRLEFLAAWSSFLASENISPENQHVVQTAMEEAQFSANAASRTLDALLVKAVVVDPLTKTTDREAFAMLNAFVKGGGYDQRLKAGQNKLEETLGSALGSGTASRFLESVWPGILEFGFIDPMIPRQVVAPVP